MSIKICGHSHIAALLNGYRLIKEPAFKVDFVPLTGAEYMNRDFTQIKKANVSFTVDRFQQAFEKATGETHFSTKHIWGLVMGGYPNRLLGGAQWKNIRPAAFWEKGTRPVSLAQLDILSYLDRRSLQNFIRDLKKTGVDVFVISLPLSIRDYRPEDTAQQLKARAFMHNRARTNFKDWLIKQNVDFIDVPKDLIMDDGFMDPDYMVMTKSTGAPDFDHGNHRYGERMMQEILDYLKRRGYTEA